MQDTQISIITSVVSKLNLAFQQNSLPVITELELKNRSTKNFYTLELVLTSSPVFLIERVWVIDNLNAESQVILNDVKVELNAEFLRSINESLVGEIKFTLKSADEVLETVSKEVQFR